jgi:hypothetical protein
MYFSAYEEMTDYQLFPDDKNTPEKSRTLESCESKEWEIFIKVCNSSVVRSTRFYFSLKNRA